jgi:tripartite-type tricarboxylate transporter receptor subunit TctC
VLIVRTPIAVIATGLALACAFGAGDGRAQDFPTKVVRILTSTPGSTNDIVARIIAQGLAASLKQPAIVENRGSLAAEIVARAEPDGHTLLFYGAAIYLMPLMRTSPYDAMRDLTPITAAVSQVTLLVVHPSLPVKSTAELIALAKARPGELNYGAGTLGAAPHLATEQFKAAAGINMTQVGYKGTGPAVIGLVSGEVVVMFVGIGSINQHIQSGRVRALAVTTPKRSPLVPNLPAIAETVPGYHFVSEIGLYAPARTPASTVNLIQRATVRHLQSAEVKERLASSGIDVVGNAPQEFSAMVKADIEAKRVLLKKIGMLRQ